ncbi:hypothetical protein L1887_18019 [Cichorium endivia]|nr:hypothetical protein L1887_18019 [Cichorium endivia]
MLSGMLVYTQRSIGGDKAGFLMNLVRQYDKEKVHELSDPHIKHQISSRSFDAIQKIAYQCISLNIKERPSMATVIGVIEHALEIQGFAESEFLGSTNMIAGNFLNVYPSELKFRFELGEVSSCALKLTNKTEQSIAFKVKAINPKECSVNPNRGIILPRSVCNVTVKIQKQKEAPPNMQCKHKFRVHAVMAPNGATTKDITTNMFNKEENKDVEEFTLRAVYVPILEES